VKRDGVSEVIGTLILVGVVVVGITLVGVLLFVNPMPSGVPTFDSIISNTSKTIYIYHKGGDPLQPGQYKILVDGGDQTANFTIMPPGSAPWSVGDTLTATYPGMPATSMPKSVVIVYNTSMSGGIVLVAVDLTKGVVPSPSFVQVATNYTTSGRILPISFTSSSTTGNLIMVSFDWSNQALSVSSVTDSKGNAYAVAAGPTNSGANARGVTYYAFNIAGGGSPVTVTITLSGVPGVNPSFEGYITEYSGIKTAAPLDQNNAGSGTGLVLDSGYRTTTQASELIYGYCWSLQTSSPDPPLVLRTNYRGNFVADRTVSSIVNTHVTGTNNIADLWLCQMATFRGG